MTAAAAGGAPDLRADYDDATRVLTLRWTPEAQTQPDSYTIYQDGAVLAEDVEALSYEIRLAAWSGGVRVYQVAAVLDGEAGLPSLPVTVGQLDAAALPCPPFVVAVWLHDPFVKWAVYPECIPEV